MTAEPSAASWDAYVSGHADSTLYHTWRWTEFASRVFAFPLRRLASYDASGNLNGVLPLILQRSPLFGSRLVSLPFFNYGGPLGDNPSIEEDLLRRAAELARSLKVRTLEIRDRVARRGHSMRQDKVTLELELPSTVEAFSQGLGKKRRSNIRRCDRDNAEIRVGSLELVDDFYRVFAANMRDLGTPVYPVRFFREMLRSLSSDCTIVSVRLHGQPAAAALLTHYRDRTEIPWAASAREFRKTQVNMRLYYECMAYAITRGHRVFDFGRSTIDSGTYIFKTSWGAVPRQLYWVYPLETETAPHSTSAAREWAARIWQCMPLSLATRVGSAISPGLPW